MHEKRKFRHLPQWTIALVLMLLLTVGILPLGIPAEAVSSPTITFEDFSGGRYTYASTKKITDVPYVAKEDNEIDTFDFDITPAENKILITTEENKKSELCYVPITSKMLVPANSTYMVEHTFTIIPLQNSSKSTDAAACFELLEFGTDLNFQKDASFKTATGDTKSNDGFGATGTNGTSLAKGYRNKKGKGSKPIGESKYTVTRTVTYKNETNAEKTITNYFGLWVATQYGISYSNGLSVSCQIDTKVTSYIVSFNANGGSVSPTSRTVTYGGTYGDLPTPTRTNYTFSGWFTAASGGRRVQATDTADGSDGSTLYAQWHKTSHRICGDITCSNTSHQSVTWTGWSGGKDKINYTNNVAGIYLTTDLPDETGFLTVQPGCTLYLCLNGKTLSSSYPYYTIRNLGTLVICDCVGTGKVVNTSNNCTSTEGSSVIYNEASASFTLYSGTLEHTNDTQSNVLINKGTATICGGTITSTKGFGIKAISTDTTMTDTAMTGGTVNSARAAVAIQGGTFTMTGGTVISTGPYSISTETKVASVVRIGGGTIKGANYGIHIYKYLADTPCAKIYLSGTPTISGNKAAIYYADYYSNIYANGWEGHTTPYSGGVLTLAYASSSPDCSETIAFVSGVTDANAGKFKHANENYKFIRKTLNGVDCLTTREKDKYEVTFEPCGGTISTTSKSKMVTNGRTYGTLPRTTRTGYKFDGWYTAQTGGTKIESSTTVTQTSDHTLYAHWTFNHSHEICTGTNCNDANHKSIPWTAWNGTDTITYTSNVAYACLTADSTQSLTVGEGDTLYLCLNGNTLSGTITVYGTLHICDCKGTGIVDGGTGRAISGETNTSTINYYGGTLKGGRANNETYIALYTSGTINLYAVPNIVTPSDYEIRGYSVGFLHICAKLSKPSKAVRVNFGAGEDKVDMTKNTQVTVTTGWSTYMSGETPTDYFLPRLNRYANIVLDGKELVLRRFHITFKNVDSTYDEGDAKYSNGELSSIPGSPTRTGYTFSGWFTAETGGERVTTAYVFSDDTIVYARWTANTYTVTFNPGSGSVTPTTITVTFGSAYGTLPTPTLEGYTFKGWFSASSGGTEVISSTPVSRTANHTLYARWELIEVISVEITWGPMEFTYSDGDWNAEKHVYENGGWVPDTDGGNRITVKNSGNVPVSVSFTYTAQNTAVRAVISDGTVAVTAPVSLPANGQKQVWLTLSGKPTGTLTKAVLGTVTIKIGGT